jgi:hypothetical protein
MKVEIYYLIVYTISISFLVINQRECEEIVKKKEIKRNQFH